LIAAAQASPSTLHVLNAPASVKFDSSAGGLPITGVASVAAAALGVAPPSEFAWDGLYAGSVFDRPLAAVTFIVDGMDELSNTEAPTYPLFHDAAMSAKKGVAAVVTGHTAPGFPALASIVSEASGRASVCVSVSADSTAAIAAGHRDLATSAVEHTVYRHGGSFVDSAVNDSPISMKDFSVEFLEGASFDQNTWTVSYAGVAFPESATNFFQELQTMVNVANALKSTKATDTSPAVLTFTVSSYAELAKRNNADVARAGKLAVEAVIKTITSVVDAAYDNRAVVLAVTLKSKAVAAKVAAKGTASGHPLVDGGFDMVQHMEEYKRSRRAAGIAASKVDPLAGNGTGIPECTNYRCMCYKAFAPGAVSSPGGKSLDGEVWAAASVIDGGDVAGCLSNKEDGAARTCIIAGADDKKNEVQCSTICVHSRSFCPCMDPTFDPSYLYPLPLKTERCEGCAIGYKLRAGVCYLEETQTSSSINIALWTGLMAVGGIAGTWYALHTIGAPMFAALGGGGMTDAKFKDM
jgi:hypothetical protein